MNITYCECNFHVHKGKTCKLEAKLVCTKCERNICNNCTLDGLRCSRCYREDQDGK